MTVGDIMREDVVTAGPNTSTAETARRMRDEDVGSVVVVDDGRPAGIVTDRDIAVGPVADGDDPESLAVESVMTPDPTTTTADAGVMELCDALCDARIRRMPVVDGTGALTGIVTLDDLAVLLGREQQALAEVVEAKSPPY